MPSIDDAAQVVFASTSANSVVLNITAGTWTVFGYGAWRTDLFVTTSELRIASVVVSSIAGDASNHPGSEWYTHFGFMVGMVGPQAVSIDFDAFEIGTSPGAYPKSFAFAVRTA